MDELIATAHKHARKLPTHFYVGKTSELSRTFAMKTYWDLIGEMEDLVVEFLAVSIVLPEHAIEGIFHGGSIGFILYPPHLCMELESLFSSVSHVW